MIEAGYAAYFAKVLLAFALGWIAGRLWITVRQTMEKIY